jgi:integrase
MLTLAAARQLAQEVHRRRALGQDVIGEHKAQQHRQRAEVAEHDANTYPAAARAFVQEYARPKTRRWLETAHWLGFDLDDNDTLTAIPGGLAQLWADKPVGAIDASDIWNVIEQARRTAVPGIKPRRPGLSETRPRSLLAMLSRLFGWLHRHRRIAHNPCAGLHRPPAPAARDRVLTSDEVRWFWAATEAVDAPKTTGAPKPFKPLLRLLLLTGARLNEVAGMKRDELHADGAWYLPSSRTKNKRPHVVPLAALARDILTGVTTDADLIFTTNNKTPVSGWNRMKRRLDASMLKMAKAEKGGKASIPPWRLHDLRRTCVTNMVELGVPPHVVELVINHVSGHKGGIAGVYNRSEMLPERREALERWAKHVAGLVAAEPANVVTLARKR